MKPISLLLFAVVCLCEIASAKQICGEDIQYEDGCRPSKCKPENGCRCAGEGTPAGLKAAETPQFITITWDDHVMQSDVKQFIGPLASLARDAGGCQIRSTFFPTGVHNNVFQDYLQIDKLALAGNSFGYHTFLHNMSGTTGHDWQAREAENAFSCMKRYTQHAHLLRGARAPFLKWNGAWLSELHKRGLQYDASMTSSTDPYDFSFRWPHTLDYGVPLSVLDEVWFPLDPPPATYPGLWEYYLHPLFKRESNGTLSQTEFTMEPGDFDEDAAFDSLYLNFLLHYKHNKAPFGVFWHLESLEGTGLFNALKRFVQNVTLLPDVYFATIPEVIDWIMHPRSLSKMKKGNGLGCDDYGSVESVWVCSSPKHCAFGEWENTIIEFDTCKGPCQGEFLPGQPCPN